MNFANPFANKGNTTTLTILVFLAIRAVVLAPTLHIVLPVSKTIFGTQTINFVRKLARQVSFKEITVPASPAILHAPAVLMNPAVR